MKKTQGAKDIKKTEKSLRKEIEREKKAIALMEKLARQKHENLELHEKKVIELRNTYTEKLKHTEQKQKELSQKEEHIASQATELGKKLKELQETEKRHNRERKETEDHLRNAQQKKAKLETELAEKQKRLESQIKNEDELSREIGKKLNELTKHQHRFEQLFQANKLLEQKNRESEEKLNRTITQAKEKETRLWAIERKLKTMSYLDAKLASELDKHKLTDIYELIKEINRYTSKRNAEDAKRVYEMIRHLYRELGPEGKNKAYRDILSARDRIAKAGQAKTK